MSHTLTSKWQIHAPYTLPPPYYVALRGMLSNTGIFSKKHPLLEVKPEAAAYSRKG